MSKLEQIHTQWPKAFIHLPAYILLSFTFYHCQQQNQVLQKRSAF